MKAMFSMDMRDKEEKETKVHYNNQMVEAFAKLFYKGAVTHTVLVANLSSFLALSDLYDLLLLKSWLDSDLHYLVPDIHNGRSGTR